MLDATSQANTAAAPAAVVPSGRWPALDGLRGWMTVGVFVAHINYNWLPGSILFMDTFFMMSSFFITRLLMKDWARNGRINFKAFYIRRVRRLFPAMLLMVLAVVAFGYFYLGQGPGQMLHAAGAVFYFMNWLRALEIPHEALLGHTWSLSIEEQFYAVWPVLLALALAMGWVTRSTASTGPSSGPLSGPHSDSLLRATPRTGLTSGSAKQSTLSPLFGTPLIVFLLSALVLFIFAWRAHLTLSGASVPRLYNGTDMRTDSLALGALLALVLDAPRVQRWCTLLAKPWLVWLLLLAFMAGGLTVGYFDRNWYLWQQSAFSCLSMVLLMAFIKDPDGWGLKWLLQNPVSLYLGSICYSVYLWHLPLIEAGRVIFGLSVWTNFAVCAPLTFALAALSYHWVELPALQGKVGSAR
jgi:peptidoglycan/LPS O-acetylase OafA/YrhL